MSVGTGKVTVETTDFYESQRNAVAEAGVPLRISRELLDAVQRHGEEIYPHECCGILLGTADGGAVTVRQALRAGNTRLDSAHNRYQIEPIDLIRAQRQAREQQLDIVGFYHSHPDHPAWWSATDLHEAHWFGCAYVITSVDGRAEGPRAHETHSFLLTGTDEETKALVPQRVVVEGDSL